MKEVFIFGSGASYASARTPLGEDLAWGYHRDCSRFATVVNGKRDPDDLKGEEKLFEDFVNFTRCEGFSTQKLTGQILNCRCQKIWQKIDINCAPILF